MLFALNYDLARYPMNGGKSMVSGPQRGHIRHPATKSVKIQNVDADSQFSTDSHISSDRGVDSRRMSTDSLHTGMKRASTGSERTPAESYRSSKSSPLLQTATTEHAPTPFAGMRQKAYHFDDDFVDRPSSTCEDPTTGHADMECTARNLASRWPPSQRHAALSRRFRANHLPRPRWPKVSIPLRPRDSLLHSVRPRWCGESSLVCKTILPWGPPRHWRRGRHLLVCHH